MSTNNSTPVTVLRSPDSPPSDPDPKVTITCSTKSTILITVIASLALAAVVIGTLAILASLPNGALSGLGGMHHIGIPIGGALAAAGALSLAALIITCLVRYYRLVKMNNSQQEGETSSTNPTKATQPPVDTFGKSVNVKSVNHAQITFDNASQCQEWIELAQKHPCLNAHFGIHVDFETQTSNVALLVLKGSSKFDGTIEFYLEQAGLRLETKPQSKQPPTPSTTKLQPIGPVDTSKGKNVKYYEVLNDKEVVVPTAIFLKYLQNSVLCLRGNKYATCYFKHCYEGNKIIPDKRLIVVLNIPENSGKTSADIVRFLETLDITEPQPELPPTPSTTKPQPIQGLVDTSKGKNAKYYQVLNNKQVVVPTAIYTKYLQDSVLHLKGNDYVTCNFERYLDENNNRVPGKCLIEVANVPSNQQQKKSSADIVRFLETLDIDEKLLK